jgi:phage N-6-adenine-methyltransferase
MKQAILGDWAIDPRDCWATPQDLFNEINTEGRFTVDACATIDNTKLGQYWTPTIDALRTNWQKDRVWCNPPYSEIGQWLDKAITAKVCAFLVPTRTDQDWWHHAMRYCQRLDFFLGRIKFIPPKGIRESSASEKHVLIWFGDIEQDHDLGITSCIRSRSAKTGKLF